MKKCNEVMTQNPFCCQPDDTAEHVARLMKTKGIGSIPVIENEDTNKLVGIVTDRDLALSVVAEALNPQATKVRDVMSRKLVTCRPDDSMRKALDAMSKNQLRRIPVVDKDGRVVGIIAQADVATRVNDAGRTGSLVKDISQYPAR